MLRREWAVMSRIVLIKLQPNQDLYAGLESACADAGIPGGVVLSGVGSLNDAWFGDVAHGDPTAVRCVPGPGLEVSGISGEVACNGAGVHKTILNGWIARADGSVTGGILVRERNIVCITFELMVLEWATQCSSA